MFKIIGLYNNERKVDCSYSKRTNYINICTEGNILNDVYIETRMRSREDVERIIDLLERTKLCFLD